jgi:hypothetical protein
VDAAIQGLHGQHRAHAIQLFPNKELKRLEVVHQTAVDIFTQPEEEFPSLQEGQEVSVINHGSDNEIIVPECGEPCHTDVQQIRISELVFRLEIGRHRPVCSSRHRSSDVTRDTKRSNQTDNLYGQRDDLL